MQLRQFPFKVSHVRTVCTISISAFIGNRMPDVVLHLCFLLLVLLIFVPVPERSDGTISSASSGILRGFPWIAVKLGLIIPAVHSSSLLPNMLACPTHCFACRCISVSHMLGTFGTQLLICLICLDNGPLL